MLNGDSGYGHSQSNKAVGVPEAAGARPGEPAPWRPFQVIW